MKHSMKKVLSLILVLTMVCGLLPSHVFAVSGGKKVSFEQTDNSSVSAQLPLQQVENGSALPDYKDSDTVRVSIVLEDESTIAAYATSGISENRQALKYRAKLQNKQSTVEAKISVQVQGVAPDAQILTMKVFGQSGGAYDSDYMAAIEDAVILGADVINLSLGAGNPGYTAITTEAYQEIFENLEQSDTVVTISAGNSGS